jgi:hypothetical protein
MEQTTGTHFVLCPPEYTLHQTWVVCSVFCYILAQRIHRKYLINVESMGITPVMIKPETSPHKTPSIHPRVQYFPQGNTGTAFGS